MTNQGKTRMMRPDPVLLRERRLVTGYRNDLYSDIFRILRTSVLRKMRMHQWRTLAVTSATQGAGKSFVLGNLAVAMAMEGNNTVLVVDTDLRNPNVAKFFGVEVEKGLLDYLNDGMPLSDILLNPGFEHVVVLPGRGTTSRSSELLSSRKMTELVQELKARYEDRLILFDLPPLLASDDAALFMPHFDAALLVVEDGRNTPEEIRRCLRILEETKLAGVVLNKAKQMVFGRYYSPYRYPQPAKPGAEEPSG